MVTQTSTDTPDPQHARMYDVQFALAFLSMSGFVLANALLAHYARWVEFLGGGVSRVGWLTGVGPVLGLILRPWLGQWINRLGARNIWAVGNLLFLLGTLGNLLLTSLSWEIYILRSLHVLGGAFVFASGLTLITQTTPAARRTEAIGSLGVAGFVGMLIGPSLGDLILGDSTRGREEFIQLFLVTTAVLVPSALLLCFVKQPPAGPASPVRLGQFIRTAKQYWPGAILVVNPVFGMCMTVPFSFLAAWVDERSITVGKLSGVGFFFILYASCAIVMRVAFRRVPDRFGRRKVLLAGLASFATGLLCFQFVNSDQPYLLAIPGLVCGAGHALSYHTMSSLAIERFPEHVRGTGSALSLMIHDLGMIAGGPVLGMIAENFGFDVMFRTISAMCFLSALIYAWRSLPVWRERRRLRTSA